jgi:hypothetical protein
VEERIPSLPLKIYNTSFVAIKIFKFPSLPSDKIYISVTAIFRHLQLGTPLGAGRPAHRRRLVHPGVVMASADLLSSSLALVATAAVAEAWCAAMPRMTGSSRGAKSAS